jgi:hypothetical protein
MEMYYEKKFAEATLLITGLFACLVMAVLFTTPEISIDLLSNSGISDRDEATSVASIVADEQVAKIKYDHYQARF